jgi:hypothetical protein
MSNNLSFRNFLLKEEESFFKNMSKIGINPKDWEKFPQYASFFSMNKAPVNFGSYAIVDFKKNENGEITHVVVKQINDPSVQNLKFDKNNPEGMRNQDNKDEPFLVTIDDLEELLRQSEPKPAPDAGMSLGGIQ